MNGVGLYSRTIASAAVMALSGVTITGCTTHYRESLADYRAAEPLPFYERTMNWIEAEAVAGVPLPAPQEAREPDLAAPPQPELADQSARVAARVLGLELDAFQELSAALLDAQTRAEALSNALTWRELLMTVALQNPRVEAARHDWLAALKQYSQAEFLEGVLREFKTFTRYLDVGAGDALQKEMPEFFPYPGTLSYRGEMVREQVRLAELAWERVLRDALIQAGTLYADYTFQFQGAATVHKNLSLLQDLIQVVQDRYAAGLATQPDVLRLQVELERQRNLALDFESRQRALAAALNALLGRPTDTPLGRPVGEALERESRSAEAVVAAALEGRQELLEQRARVAQGEIVLRMGEIMNRPLASAGYSTLDRGMMPEASTGPSTAPFGGQPDVAAPQAAYARTEAYLAESRERLASERAALEQLVLETRAMARARLEAVDVAARQVALIRDVVLPLNQSAYEISLNAYTVGTLSFLDLLDAERKLIDSRLELDESLRDLNQAILNVAAARGSL